MSWKYFWFTPVAHIWADRDHGAWTIPKGEYEGDEEPLAAAQREFQEETGFTATGPFLELGSIRQRSGKIVIGWAFEGDCDPALLVSNMCEVEWPPRSGHHIEIHEIDRGRWLSMKKAHKRIRKEQRPLLEALSEHLA